MTELKYKIGDKVRIKSLDWYNKNKNVDGIVELSTHVFVPGMSKYCGMIVTIDDVFEDTDGNVAYYMDGIDWDWTNEMIEGLVKEEDLIPKFGDEPLHIPTMTTDFIKEYGLSCPNGYQFKDENDNVINTNKIVLEKKKNEYPKTYEECRDLIEGSHVEPFCADLVATGYLSKLMERFARLIICRDAYWKIAGKEMGLGKPWEPDWSTESEIKYVIEVYRNNVRKNSQGYSNTILAFPTAEMRDAFKENFDPDIEICKELL